MNFVGEIVEHEVKAPEPLSFPEPGTSSGFPKIVKAKPSAWRQRLQEKGISSMSNSLKAKRTADNKEYVKARDGTNRFVKEQDKKLNYEGLSEAEKIHQENIELLSRMSVDEREEAKEELLSSLDPDILQMLLNRSVGRSGPAPPQEEEVGEWYGSTKTENWGKPMDEEAVNKALGIKSEEELKEEMERFGQDSVPVKQEKEVEPKTASKKVSFAEEEEDSEDIAEFFPNQAQIDQVESQMNSEAISNIHFPAAPSQEIDDDKLDINDPDFNEKLHEKYFPDLPKDTEHLKWMEPVPNTKAPEVIESVKDLRFSFKGDLITPEESQDIPTYLGLHHHADQPQLPGYTLAELAHYARSTFNSQRCIAIQTLGRILHKLGKGKFNFQTVDEADEIIEEDQNDLNDNLWDLVNELKIVSTLQEFSDEQREKNLSVRNYSIEALWLWKQGGGDKRVESNDS